MHKNLNGFVTVDNLWHQWEVMCFFCAQFVFIWVALFLVYPGGHIVGWGSLLFASLGVSLYLCIVSFIIHFYTIWDGRDTPHFPMTFDRFQISQVTPNAEQINPLIHRLHRVLQSYTIFVWVYHWHEGTRDTVHIRIVRQSVVLEHYAQEEKCVQCLSFSVCYGGTRGHLIYPYWGFWAHHYHIWPLLKSHSEFNTREAREHLIWHYVLTWSQDNRTTGFV